MKRYFITIFLVLAALFSFSPETHAATLLQDLQQDQEYTEYKGRVLSSDRERPVGSAQLTVLNTNIATVTNADGEFSLKVPSNIGSAIVRVSYLGFESKNVALEYFSEEGTEIFLDPSVEELSEISIFQAEDAGKLVRSMLAKRGDNYLDRNTNMTAFYRESIRKGRKNVSLSEAVIKIHKKPYTSSGKEDIELIRARKTADYDKLDTLALKLRGGPYNALFVDVMKYPEYVFYIDDISDYSFSFNEPTQIDGRYLYVVNFEAKERSAPWYFGKLYIDAQSNSLVRAELNLNVDNRSVASRLFVSKKPGSTRVYPIEVKYLIDYQQQDGKWFYGYGSADLTFVVNWKRKLFNSRYYVHSEMAVTGWKPDPGDVNPRRSDSYLKPTVVMTDDVSGFSDPEFWGSNNIIEPDKDIQNAIEKIREQLD
ncbi:carboxypeptidase-like regulatory domain-containing protein [Salegentibacter sediminis]|uniref:carboxypeptidase-like regulatory domain-containing protein n=1 Tax=Salegentibacter sediminis TaxID=1930251 RepID=UPI001E3CBAD9|nr:carboxypeptidase-like regulatory domain-containing protein [Salegentibacter sediminis]